MIDNALPTIGNCQLHKRYPRIAASVTDQITEDALLQQKQHGLEIAELRLDLCRNTDHVSLDATIKRIHAMMPLIVTWRTEGRVTNDPRHLPTTRYLSTLQALLCEEIDALDIELMHAQRMPVAAMELVRKARQYDIITIFSYHNFLATPDDATLYTLAASANRLHADIIKIACLSVTEEDIARLENFTRCDDYHLITIAMGEIATLSRVTMGEKGSLITFGSGEQITASGQLPIATLRRHIDAFYSLDK